MKLNKSLGGRIAHQQLTSSQKISIPPFQLEMKKRKQWGEEHTISKPSMRAFFDIYRIVSVRSISHFKPFSFLVLYQFRRLFQNVPEHQTLKDHRLFQSVLEGSSPLVAKIENFFCKYPDISFGLNLSSSSNPGSEFLYLARKAQNQLILDIPMSKI